MIDQGVDNEEVAELVEALLGQVLEALSSVVERTVWQVFALFDDSLHIVLQQPTSELDKLLIVSIEHFFRWKRRHLDAAAVAGADLFVKGEKALVASVDCPGGGVDANLNKMHKVSFQFFAKLSITLP